MDIKQLIKSQEAILQKLLAELCVMKKIKEEELTKKVSISRIGFTTIVKNADDERETFIHLEMRKNDLFPYLLIHINVEDFPETKKEILSLQEKGANIYVM